MSLDDVDNNNHDANFFPFANCELAIDVHLGLPLSQKSTFNKKTKTKKNPKERQSKATTHEKNTNVRNTTSYIYFENTEKENNFLTFISYTGPSNTSHLGTSLYLPQLISNPANDSTVCFEKFIEDYDRTIVSLTPSLETMSLSVYLRFGILYTIPADTIRNQTMPLKDFTSFVNEGKQIKKAFYTCKGVTSPKHLLTTITKLNYHQMSSNTYSYDIQLYGTKNTKYSVLHFQYDEQLQCQLVYFRPDYPINFDFIRNKTSSIFRSVDNSYSDIFDFRIQLIQTKHLSKIESDVLDILRGVPINQVLSIDPSTHVLHISSKLQKFVKYLKCTRSSNYQNLDEQILISIGTYEEFQLNTKGQCEILMKTSNTMTIELLDVKTIPSGKKLYDIGMWFSTLCQTCVDLSPVTTKENNATKSCKWFSNISVFGKKQNESIKQMNVNQLTTYATQNSNQTYTSEELAFVKRILQEENLQYMFLNTNEEKCYDRKDLEQIFENIKKKLNTTAAPSASVALKRVERAYRVACEEFPGS